VGIVELVRRNQVSDPSELLKLIREPAVKPDWRVKEQVAVRQTYNRHPGREWERKPDARDGKIFKWPIDDADVGPDPFVSVNRFVE
jgi:hypothetical protein